MKNIDPIKNMSARDLAEVMIQDLESTLEELAEQLQSTDIACTDIVSLCTEIEKCKYALAFIREYAAPIKATIVDEYNSLKSSTKQKAFIDEHLKMNDPFELLASGLLTGDNEGIVVGITIPGDPDGCYVEWLITEVGSDYVKIMTNMPIPDGKGRVVYPEVVIGNGMDADEIISTVFNAIKDTTLVSKKEEKTA